MHHKAGVYVSGRNHRRSHLSSTTLRSSVPSIAIADRMVTWSMTSRDLPQKGNCLVTSPVYWEPNIQMRTIVTISSKKLQLNHYFVTFFASKYVWCTVYAKPLTLVQRPQLPKQLARNTFYWRHTELFCHLLINALHNSSQARMISWQPACWSCCDLTFCIPTCHCKLLVMATACLEQ